MGEVVLLVVANTTCSLEVALCTGACDGGENAVRTGFATAGVREKEMPYEAACLKIFGIKAAGGYAVMAALVKLPEGTGDDGTLNDAALGKPCCSRCESTGEEYIRDNVGAAFGYMLVMP